MKSFLWFFSVPVSLTFLALGGLVSSAPAQIVEDTTLPHASRITPSGHTLVITGGTQRGSNLFHSFRKFSVPAQGTASFQGIDPAVTNIFSRITGSTASHINGVIEVRQVNGSISRANFFLLNPNGILFGPNASLNIGGSFLSTTANSIRFRDGTGFSAVLPQNRSLLSISVPVGLQFGNTPSQITNRSTVPLLNQNGSLLPGASSIPPIGLSVSSAQTLALVGGDIALPTGGLFTVGGRIELGSVGGPGLVSLTPTNQGWRLGYERVQAFGDIHLSRLASVNTSGAAGGSIQLQGRRITLMGGSQVGSTTLGSERGAVVHVAASDSVTVDGSSTSGVLSQLYAEAGKESTGRAGNLIVETPQLRVLAGGVLTTATSGAGRAGDLTIRASDVIVDGIALLPNGRPRQAPDQSTLPSNLNTQPLSSGNGGTLKVEAQRLTLSNGATLQTTTTGSGNAGELIIQAADSINVTGQDSLGFPTLIDAGSSLEGDSKITERSLGRAGDLQITTRALSIRDGAEISVRSENANDVGGAGNLWIHAETVLLDQRGSLAAAAESGKGGNINLQVEEALLLRHGSNISSTAGVSRRGGSGGNITINASHGLIVTVPSENSDISANAYRDRGGRIEIAAQGVFGFQTLNLEELQRLLNTKDPDRLFASYLPTSDITAVSQTSPRLSGQITFTISDNDPSRGLVELPTNLLDASRQIVHRCRSGSEAAADRLGEFIITGRGGLPPDPADPGSSAAVQTEWATLEPEENPAATSTTASPDTSLAPLPAPILEAQGWLVGADGKVMLTAQAPTATPHYPPFTPANCD
jgi:filamentous hemagglutinin family protein